MSDTPKLPIERAREVMATWNADGTWRERNALNLPGEVDDLADALEALIREHETLLVGLSRQLASAEAALLAREDWIDPQRLRAIADAVDGEKAAYLIAYQRGDWGVYAAREYGDLGRASTAAEAIEAAERTLGADA